MASPMQCFEGRILTVNPNDDVARYLVTCGDKIVFVGNELPEKYAGVPRVELGARAHPRVRGYAPALRVILDVFCGIERDGRRVQ